MRGCAPALARAQGRHQLGLSLFYRQCALVLSPSPAADESLLGLGIERSGSGAGTRGVDTARFDPALRDADALSG